MSKKGTERGRKDEGGWDLPEELIQVTNYDGIDAVTANMLPLGAVCSLMRENSGDATGRYQGVFQKGAEKERADEGTNMGMDIDADIADIDIDTDTRNRHGLGVRVNEAVGSRKTLGLAGLE